MIVSGVPKGAEPIIVELIIRRSDASAVSIVAVWSVPCHFAFLCENGADELLMQMIWYSVREKHGMRVAYGRSNSWPA